MKYLGNAVIFICVYMVLMLPTYYLPYVGSNSAVIGTLGAITEAGVHPAFWMHLAALVGLVVVTWFRGVYVEKKWLVVLPIIATLFDLAPGLNIIPLIPTTMHILTMVLGVAAAKPAPQMSN